MISNRVAHLAMLAGIAALFLNGSAQAKSVRCADIPDCATRFEEAKRLAKSGDKADALARFQAIQNEYGDARTIYPIAVLLQRLGQPADAAEMFQRYLDSGVETDASKLALVRERLTTAQGEAAAAQSLALPLKAAPIAEKQEVGLVPAMKSESPVMEKSSRTPLHKRWWLWTAVGTVAVGTALGIGTAVTLYARPPTWPDALETRPFP